MSSVSSRKRSSLMFDDGGVLFGGLGVGGSVGGFVVGGGVGLDGRGGDGDRRGELGSVRGRSGEGVRRRAGGEGGGESGLCEGRERERSAIVIDQKMYGLKQ